MKTLTRTGVNGEADLSKIQAIQNGYKLQPLSEFLGTGTPTAATKIDWPKYDAAFLTDIDFFGMANLVLAHTIAKPER